MMWRGGSVGAGGKMQRVFIGLPVEEHAQVLIDRLLEPYRRVSPAIRWVAQGDRHLTLAFLGSTKESEVDRLLHSFDRTYQQRAPFQLQFSALQRFPGSRSGIIALTGPATRPLEQLLQATRGLLIGNSIGYEKKEFRPHITLARIRGRNNLQPVIDQQTAIMLTVSSVVLYQSTQTETGSSYRRLKETSLDRQKAVK